MVWEEGKYQFLGLFDGVAILVWFIILWSSVNSTYTKNAAINHYRYYKLGFYAKLVSAVVFSIIYIYTYEGGDSTAYWDTAQKLNNLFWDNPSKYLSEMLNDDPLRERYYCFNFTTTGMPPNWIYKEDEAWFTARVLSLLTFFTFKSYFAMTMIASFFSFKVSWMLYELVIKYHVVSDRIAAIGILFLPSTCFWCTGLTKDMLIYTCIIYLLIQLFTFLNPKQLKEKRNIILGVLAVYLIIYIRDFMLIVAIGPFFMALGARWSRSQNSGFSKWLIQLTFASIILFAMFSFLNSEKGQEFAAEAEVIQNDLKTNTTYGENRYDLGISDFSAGGMISAMPISIYTAFYRPYPWESDSIFIFISAIEACLFLFFTIRFIFTRNLLKSFREISNNELLMGSLVFSLILGFFAGYTAGLFGVLVRFKAPLLPMLFLVLMYKIDKQNLEK